MRGIRSRQFEELHRSALPLATGFVGTVAVFLVQLPMPALLGPMLVNGFLCLNGLRLNISRLFFPPIFITIGIYIGSKMGTDTFSKLIGWLPSIIFLVIFMLLATFLGAYYFQRYAKFDKLTAVYASLPGAFASILAQTSHLHLDHKKIILSQSIRVFLVVGLLPLFLVLYINEPLYSGAVALEATNNSWLSWGFCLALIVCLSGVLANFKVPSPYLLGSIMGSGFFFATGQLSGPLPNMPLIIALYLLGSIIGTRFSGCTWRELWQMGLHGLVVSLIIIIVSAIGAVVTSFILGIDALSLLLSYGPGGINEISIIAYTFDITPTLVVFLHFVRILIITFALPFIPRMLGVAAPISMEQWHQQQQATAMSDGQGDNLENLQENNGAGEQAIPDGQGDNQEEHQENNEGGESVIPDSQESHQENHQGNNVGGEATADRQDNSPYASAPDRSVRDDYSAVSQGHSESAGPSYNSDDKPKKVIPVVNPVRVPSNNQNDNPAPQTPQDPPNPPSQTPPNLPAKDSEE